MWLNFVKALLMATMKANVKLKIMKNLVELSKEEAIQIEGGSVAYDVGRYIGSWCANVVDFWHGVYNGVFS